MDRPTSIVRLGVAALLAGLVVVVLQLPWGGGVDTDPPTCYRMFAAWTVPCGGGPAVAAGAITALLVWLVLLVKENPRLTHPRSSSSIPPGNADGTGPIGRWMSAVRNQPADEPMGGTPQRTSRVVTLLRGCP